MNEKRYGDQENMESLAEFVSATSADMNNRCALKQNKAAVLHETVLQVNALMGQGLYFVHCHSFTVTCTTVAICCVCLTCQL